MSDSRVIFWDFDGTLAHRPGNWSGVMAEVLLADDPGCSISEEHLRPILRSGFPWHTPEVPHLHLCDAEAWWRAAELSFARHYGAVGIVPERAERLAQAVRSRYVDPSGFSLYDDTLPVLRALRESGWRHRVISNHVPELGYIAAAMGLNGLIEHITNSAEVGYEKPHPEIYRLALKAAGNPEGAWMVGDNVLADVLGAEQAGLRAILVRRADAQACLACADLHGAMEIIEGS
jgi:putative hydrolase of the HAD superfamily